MAGQSASKTEGWSQAACLSQSNGAWCIIAVLCKAGGISDGLSNCPKWFSHGGGGGEGICFHFNNSLFLSPKHVGEWCWPYKILKWFCHVNVALPNSSIPDYEMYGMWFGMLSISVFFLGKECFSVLKSWPALVSHPSLIPRMSMAAQICATQNQWCRFE